MARSNRDPFWDLDPQADLDGILRDRLNIEPLVAARRRGPFGSLLVKLSAADTRILDTMPTEEKKYQLLGSLVLATGVLAFLATTWALAGTIGTSAAVGIGLILGLAVLVVDRALVALPLNPVRLPRVIGQSLWDPQSAGPERAKHYAEIVDARRGGRLRTMLGVAVRLVPRVAIALCLSFIIAEGVLLVRFRDDIDRRARAILDVTRSSSQTAINAYYKNEIQRKQAEITALETGGTSGEAQQVTDRLAADQQVQATMQTDINTLEELWQAEMNGRQITRTLSDGTSFTTSGQRKCAERCRSYKDAQAKLGDQLTAVNQRVTDDQNLLATYQQQAQAAQAANQPAIDALHQAIAQLQKSQQARLDEIAADVKPSVLLQIQALEELAVDPTPAVREENDVLAGNQLVAGQAAATAPGPATAGSTPTSTPTPTRASAPPATSAAAATATVRSPTCTGGWLDTAWCSLRTWLVPNTPLGPQIAAWRYFFLLFDLMPILAKAVLSLRRVRPYDEVEAGLAMITRVRMLNSVDWQLNQVGADWEDRAAERRSRRAISDAMVFPGSRRLHRVARVKLGEPPKSRQLSTPPPPPAPPAVAASAPD